MTDADTETSARFIAKEGSDGTPFIAVGPGVIRLHFQRPASLDHAERTAKWLNHYFRISIGRES